MLPRFLLINMTAIPLLRTGQIGNIYSKILFFFKSISTYIETRFDNTVQCDPMIHFIANFYRLYCLLVFFF
jgi:hypothetical protein